MGTNVRGLDPVARQATFVYDFALDGGAIGAIVLGAGAIPKDSLVMGGIVRVITALTSGGSATIALSVVGANDVISALAVASWTISTQLAVLPLVYSNALVTTAASGLTVTIATATLLTGKFICWLNYFPYINV